MVLLKITVLWCACFFIAAAESNFACTTPDNQQGQCTPIKQCSVLFSLLANLTNEKISHLRKSKCGSDSDETNPKVCCPPKELILFHKNSALLPKKYECGLFSKDKIFSGEFVGLGYYPWTVLLKYQKDNQLRFLCAGILINQKYVLTAAHCLSEDHLPKNATLISVRLGEYNLDQDPDCELEAGAFKVCSDPFVEIPIEEKVVHEGYSKNNSNLLVENDIALLRLKTKVTYNDFVSPACLPIDAKDLERSYNGASLWRAGWGISKSTAPEPKKIINEVLWKNPDECNKMFNVTLTENQFCGIRRRTYGSRCSGDTGGAVTLFSEDRTVHYVAGIEIMHGPCTDEQIAVYTRVTGYMKWIVDNLRE